MDIDDGSSQAMPAPHDAEAKRAIDLTFVLDTTGSMGSYIASATENIEKMCDAIVQSGKLPSAEALRVALIAYRDHPPQDNSYVTRKFDFTSNISQVKESLKSLYASGGGDGPEAVTAALYEAMTLQWNPQACKIAVLIADAPPHGCGEYGDGFADGSPDGHDPLQIVREMQANGITLFVVACEPALSNYIHAKDVFAALAQISSSIMLPLVSASLLAQVIVMSALEQLDLERLITEVGDAVAERIHQGQESVEDVAKELHEKLMLRNENTKQLVVENIYRENPDADYNVSVWANAPDLATARPNVRKITGSRFTDKYLAQRYGTSSSFYRTIATAVPPVPSRPTAPSSPPRTSTTTTPSSPSSPSRQIATNFASFSAKPQSLADTPMDRVGPTAFGNPQASEAVKFGRIRESGGIDDDDDESGGFGLLQQEISLDQARRITTQAAWRSARR